MSEELTRSALAQFPLPPIEDTGKNERGKLLIVAGSAEVPGSALLCAVAALRSGVGKVRIATSRAVSQGLALQIPEAFVIGLDEHESSEKAALDRICEEVRNADAIVAGPGMTRGQAVAQIGRTLLKGDAPLVLDAAVLHVLRELAGACRGAEVPPVLLPHSGEMAAMLGCSSEQVKRDPLAAAKQAAEQYRAFVLAKGATSHVAAPDGRCWTYDGGVPGLGTAGSGDALAGIVGAQIARGAEPLTALLWAVFLHGEAGEALARKVGPIGFLAREIAGEIPALMAREAYSGGA